jgi:hypothetical protein
MGGAHADPEGLAAAPALGPGALLLRPGLPRPERRFCPSALAANAGAGQTPHDIFGVSLCRAHHDEQHRFGADTFGIAEIVPVTPVEFDRMIQDGEINNAPTIVAAYHAKLRGLF